MPCRACLVSTPACVPDEGINGYKFSTNMLTKYFLLGT